MTHPDPIAFSIGNIDIRWYGVLIATGMLLAVLIACKRAPQQGLTDDDVLDTVIWMLPIGVIGARLYYVLFNLKCKFSCWAENQRLNKITIHIKIFQNR